jgi:hypothetical protein
MHESFIHYLWQMQYFDKQELKTTDGETIEVFTPGTLNADAGPDFSNARVKIGGISWVGTVEVHINSSMWFEHRHDVDGAYDNVILHVVWKHDSEIVRADNTRIPTLEIGNRVDPMLLKSYRQLASSSFAIPCKRSLPAVSDIVRLSMLDKALLLRLERKAAEVLTLYRQNDNDWDETFYQLLARNFGFKLNAEPFFHLARSLPQKLLRKHGDQPEQVEALLFGQAGYLEKSKGDDYYLRLKREHRTLAHKYSILETRMSRSQWKFLRLRPANFPTLRLAQFAALIQARQNIFSEVIASESLKSFVGIFSVPPSSYWFDHYQFGKRSTRATHEFGVSSIENLLINTVCPVMAAFGRHNDNQDHVDRAIQLLQEISPEENRITRSWTDIGLVARSSFDSQALIELYNNFCQRNNCLNCNIGASLVRPAK